MQRKRILLFLLLNLSISCLWAQFSASGTYVEYPPQAASKLHAVYVFKSQTGASISYSAPSGSTVSISCYQYNQSDALPVPDADINTSTVGAVTTYTISKLQDSRGYIFRDSAKPAAEGVYIVYYSQHQPQLTSMEVVEEADRCDYIKLYIDKSDVLNYYDIDAGPIQTIKYEYTLSYQTLTWKADKQQFDAETLNQTLTAPGSEIILSAPLVDTDFVLQGDQFARQFGLLQEVSTAVYTAVATSPHVIARQEQRDNANEQGNKDGSLGGSAPVTINFDGYSNEPVTRFYTWYIYNKKDLENPIVRYTDRDIKYEFTQWGDYRVVLETADQTSACAKRDSVELSISESMLDVPNYFSPGDSPGSNDEFRVAYKSLISFKCTIFNRWGTKLYEWRDPAKGWDGKYGGRYVSTGVYFYAIEAKGSDGIVYKKKGDINILRSK